MRIICSIVCYRNPPSQIDRLLSCVFSSSIDVDVFIIDNSPDATLADVAHCYEVSYQNIPENLGFGRAHNRLMRIAIDRGYDFHLILNPDVEFNKDTIRTLAAFLDRHPDVGAVAPKVFYPDGNIQPLCKLLPTPRDLIFRRFFPTLYKKSGWLDKYELRSTGYNQVMNVPSLSGSFILFRCSVLKEVGCFDERFFMYLEDVDLCRRIGRISKTMFCPDASIYHEYGKGSYQNQKLFIYHACSAIQYFNKWGWFFDGERHLINQEALANIEKLAEQ